MELITPLRFEPAASLALALVGTSKAPLLLLDDQFIVVSASASFCRDFDIDPLTIEGLSLAKVGAGEWAVPQLRSLLQATLVGNAGIDAYEMDLVRAGRDTACIVVSAQLIDLADGHLPLIAVTVTDITASRLAEKIKDALVKDKEVLLRELQHRVANSLQIIASVLMQSARRVQSDETRTHLYSAHNRVMSIATLQKQLAISTTDQVKLRDYLNELCSSIGASMIDDPDRVRLTATVDESEMPSNISVSLGLIVTELVINALKHAFPVPGQTGAIAVAYARAGEGWILNVDDNGVGYRAGEGQGKPGLGTGIVDALAKQLGATVSTTDRNPGTRVSVVAP